MILLSFRPGLDASSRELKNLTLANAHLKRELTICKRSRDEAVEKARLLRVNLSILSIENEHLRQTNKSMGRLATSTLSANQGLQKQLKLLSHPGIDVFIGRRRKSEGPYYAGMASAESLQQVHGASQRLSESEAGSDTGSRRPSMESGFASGYLNTETGYAGLNESSSERVEVDNSSGYEAMGASSLNVMWGSFGTPWAGGGQQISLASGDSDEREKKKQGEQQLEDYSWIYLDHGYDASSGGGFAAGNLYVA